MAKDSKDTIDDVTRDAVKLEILKGTNLAEILQQHKVPSKLIQDQIRYLKSPNGQVWIQRYHPDLFDAFNARYPKGVPTVIPKIVESTADGSDRTGDQQSDERSGETPARQEHGSRPPSQDEINVRVLHALDLLVERLEPGGKQGGSMVAAEVTKPVEPLRLIGKNTQIIINDRTAFWYTWACGEGYKGTVEDFVNKSVDNYFKAQGITPTVSIQ